MIASASSAADFTVGTAETTTNAGNTFSNNDSMTVTTSGSINVTSDDALNGTVDFFTLTNNGTLSATNAVPPVFPFGAIARDGVDLNGANNTVANNGVITSSHFDAIDVNGSNATVTNNGTLNAGVDGIAIFGTNSTVRNTGTITSTFDGIYLIGDNANVVNSGTINASDDGIDTAGASDVITNTGTITAARDGIETDGSGVVVTSSGIVTAGSDAFDLNGDNSTLNLQFGSRTEGLLSFDGLNGTFNIGAGFNAAFTTDGGNPSTISAARGAYLQDGNTIFAINPDQSFSGLAHAANMASNLHSTAQTQTRAGRNDVATQGMGSVQIGPWLQLSTDFTRGFSTTNSAGFATRSGQVTTGLAFSDSLGIFVGGNDARAQRSNSFETDSTTLVAGLYGTIDLDGADLNWSLVGGRIRNDAQRFIQNNTIAGGWETASASYEQSFVAPALTYAMRLQPGLLMDLELGYMALQTDGYTETGATNIATFGARNTHKDVCVMGWNL